MAESYFLPPVDRKVPALERLSFIGGYPSSRRWRSFLWTWLGRDVVITGTTYQGGRWNGPLSAQQVTDITAAGYGARIYTVTDLGQLPANID